MTAMPHLWRGTPRHTAQNTVARDISEPPAGIFSSRKMEEMVRGFNSPVQLYPRYEA